MCPLVATYIYNVLLWVYVRVGLCVHVCVCFCVRVFTCGCLAPVNSTKQCALLKF